ncbi:deoxyribodipyrimidine photo-lyase [Bacteroidetes/Chlorobi group bacterium Naka2016]|nr:MAG: deoxyribodipyrimidine photo-lyase [Bacteroidetes/Chlorobi group bacterium Naka2016]
MLMYKFQMEKVNILWFRRDLRTRDNPILFIKDSTKVLPIFIFDKNILKNLNPEDRRISFLFDQVLNLKKELKDKNLDLALFFGTPANVFDYLCTMFDIFNIYSSSDNDPYSKERDNQIHKLFNLKIVHDNFLLQPETIKSKDGKSYTVFTHFKNAVSPIVELFRNYQIPSHFPQFKLAEYQNFNQIIEVENGQANPKPIEITSLGFKRTKIEFEGALKTPQQLLSDFEKIADNYDKIRNFPSVRGTSLLSVHLRFGTISIRELFRWALEKNYNSFVSELIWREFFNYILFNFPKTINENLQKNIKVEWKNNLNDFEKWKNGETGIPLVDAGIRELVQTGYMHNRVRMVVASLLTKNLLIDWKLGEEFFAEYLFDYETSSNIGNWQWVAGVGTDPRSATRIFNPFIQSKKFDPDCQYIYKYVPELKNIPPDSIHSYDFIFNNKIPNYSKPIIKDLNATRIEFFRAYKKIKDEK